MNAKNYIYRNLRTDGFSIKYKGLVICRSNRILVIDAIFKVNELSRQRVIKEGQKNVHAYIVTDTYYPDYNSVLIDQINRVTYNPYRAATFMYKGKLIETAHKLILCNGSCYVLEE